MRPAFQFAWDLVSLHDGIQILPRTDWAAGSFDFMSHAAIVMTQQYVG